eukprot:Tamp_15874.p1 GENE.Tamp_15874~~Tamp_15874.p1  ORF type:complete len:355 (+),score=48.53 Tamp_15874:1-1065(+)
MSLIMPRRSAALLVLCATLLTCTPASATWTGSYYQVSQDEKKAGGTCDTSSNPPTCAKVKELTRSTAQEASRITRLEMTATTSCYLLPDPVNYLVYAEYNCDTLAATWWVIPAQGATCPTTTPTATYDLNGTYLTKESFLDFYTGGCASLRIQARDPSGNDACTPAVYLSVSRVLPGYNTTSGDLVTEAKKLCPAWYATPPTAAPATTPAPAATDTQHFVTMTVTMPYSKAEFDTAKQDKYKVAVANAAGTTAANVEILSITDGRRRAGSVKVETKIRASDSSGVEKLITTLGTGDDLKTKLNSELKKQGLAEATGVTAVAKAADLSSATAAVSPKWVMVLVVHVLALGLINRP